MASQPPSTLIISTSLPATSSQVGLTDVITAGIPLIAPKNDHARTTPINKSMLVDNTSQARQFVYWSMGKSSDLMKIISELNGPTVKIISAAVESSRLNGIPATAHASWPIP